LFIGLRSSRSQSRSGFVSFITFFSIAGILLGVASLITVVSVMNGFEGELKKRILGIVPHVVIANQKPKVSNNTGVENARLENVGNWQSLRNKLIAQPHILQATPFLETEALIQSPKDLQGILLQGIMPKFEQQNIINKHIIAGDFSHLSTVPYSIVLGQSLAQKLNVSLSDKVRIMLPNKAVYTPMGRLPVQRAFTIVGIFNVGSQMDDAMVYVHSQYGAKLLKQKGDGINQLRLYLDDAFNATRVVEHLIAKKVVNEEQYQLTTWNESQGAFFSAVKMEKNMMWLMLSLIVAVAAFNIVSALVMVVIDKQGEIGILQTLGMDRSGIIKIFITQGMVNGLWGVMLGSILGVLLTLKLNALMSLLGVSLLGAGYVSQQLPMQLVLSDVVTIVISALIMSFAATLYPAYRASTTQPAEVLRNE